MITNDEDLKELEKYTFSKYWKNKNNIEQFSQINSFTNNFILNYQPSNNINTKAYTNNIEIIKSKNGNPYNKDINYNQLNINNYQKSPLKKYHTNINSINNLNIMSQYKYATNSIKNYNNINNMNINNYTNKNIFSKVNKNEQRKRYKTPDKNLNYNKFNFINPYDSERKNHLYYNESQNNSNKHLPIFNKINYNENIKKINNRKIKKALTPDNTNIRNLTNIRKNVFIPTNNNKRSTKFNNKNNYSNLNLNLGIQKIDNLNSVINNNNLNFLGLGDNYLNKNIVKNQNDYNFNYKYNYSNSIINKTNYNSKNNINNNKINNNLNSVFHNNNEYIKYSESSFNNRIPRGSRIPLINKNLVRSVCNNKTPSPVRKNNNIYLENSFYNSNNKKPLKYTRSASCDDYKQNYNKLKTNIFKLSNKDLNYKPESSFLNNQKKINRNNKKLNINNSSLIHYKLLNNKYSNKNSFSNYNNSSGYNNSSIFDNKNNSSSLNDKNYNMTQPEFTNSLYNIGTNSDKNNIFNNNNSTKELYYKYNKNDSQSYNYKLYIESYNNESIKDNNMNKNCKNEITNKNSRINKYNYYSNNINLSKGDSNKKNMGSNYFTKLSTNNNTFDENSNNSNTSCCKDSKNNKKMDTIEEVHINFVNILQNTKSMMRNQENLIKDRVIYNNINSSVIIVEERDIE